MACPPTLHSTRSLPPTRALASLPTATLALRSRAGSARTQPIRLAPSRTRADARRANRMAAPRTLPAPPAPTLAAHPRDSQRTRAVARRSALALRHLAAAAAAVAAGPAGTLMAEQRARGLGGQGPGLERAAHFVETQPEVAVRVDLDARVPDLECVELRVALERGRGRSRERERELSRRSSHLDRAQKPCASVLHAWEKDS
eukprot:2022085-Rhodomonas_salina.3